MTKDDTYDIAQVQFNPLKVKEEFIDYAYVNIALNWVLRVLQGVPALQEVFNSSNTKASEAIIKDIVTWKKFSDSCFVPLSDVNNWSHGIYRLKDPLLLTSINDDTRFNRLESEDNLKIVTAYHTSIKKRVIVDGFHRAAALEAEIKNGKRVSFPKVTIWECYGNLIHTIFPFEFSHLLTPYTE